MLKVIINGEEYQSEPTMGAMLRFKKETGREFNEMDPNNLTDLCTFMWCCVVSAAKREGRDFNLSLIDFADCITPDELLKWNTTVSANREESDDSEEKKSL